MSIPRNIDLTISIGVAIEEIWFGCYYHAGRWSLFLEFPGGLNNLGDKITLFWGYPNLLCWRLHLVQ